MTLGGCMGDGQHAWAAAEWVLMMRSIFITEENGSLSFLPGIPDRWLRDGSRFSMGPISTLFGPVTIAASVIGRYLEVEWSAQWREVPSINLAIPGRARLPLSGASGTVRIEL
jgi:hypothetical protein